MAIKLSDGNYACSYCKQVYNDPEKADTCRNSHDLIYVALPMNDLLDLIQFIYTKESRLISPRLLKELKKYAKIKTDNKGGKTLPSMQNKNKK